MVSNRFCPKANDVGGLQWYFFGFTVVWHLRQHAANEGSAKLSRSFCGKHMPWAVSQVGAGELGVVATATASSSIYIMVGVKSSTKKIKRGADHKSFINGLGRSAAELGPFEPAAGGS